MSFDVAVVPVEAQMNLAQPDQNDPTQNAAFLYLLTLGTKQSREKVKRLLNGVARAFGYEDLTKCEWGKMRAVHILTKKADMEQKGKSPATINLLVSVLKGVAKQAWSLGQISDHDQAVILAVKGSRGNRTLQDDGRALAPEESSQLFTSCDLTTVRGCRDALIIGLGIACGLRRTEIAELKIKNVDRAAGILRVLGKGNKLRNVYPSPEVWKLLDRWLSLRGREGCPNLICGIRKGDKLNSAKPLTGNSIYMILRRRGVAAGISKFAPHDMRRTFATRMFEQGADINIVRKALGHSSITTTERYDKRDEEEVRRYAALIQV